MATVYIEPIKQRSEKLWSCERYEPTTGLLRDSFVLPGVYLHELNNKWYFVDHKCKQENQEHFVDDLHEFDCYWQEVQRALRMVDTAHTREQVAQETIENLRQQINRLHSEVEAKSRHSDQDGELVF